MLIEVARKRGNYLPDLSFGTHFFQDLVKPRFVICRSIPTMRASCSTKASSWAPSMLVDILPEAAHWPTPCA